MLQIFIKDLKSTPLGKEKVEIKVEENFNTILKEAEMDETETITVKQ